MRLLRNTFSGSTYLVLLRGVNRFSLGVADLLDPHIRYEWEMETRKHQWIAYFRAVPVTANLGTLNEDKVDRDHHNQVVIHH